jgi:post-segregation antitoxin (ccd killing protein)
MMAIDSEQGRRLNIMIGEKLLMWVSAAAKSRGVSVSALVREALERELVRAREEDLSRAAEELAPLYETDIELTALTALDGENFT